MKKDARILHHDAAALSSFLLALSFSSVLLATVVGSRLLGFAGGRGFLGSRVA